MANEPTPSPSPEYAWSYYTSESCTFRVIYYANGYKGSNAQNPPPSDARYYNGKPVRPQLTLGLNVAGGESMSNPGYVFVGWALSANTPTVSYNPGERISHSWPFGTVSDIYTAKLYAVWTDQNVVTYTPDSNSDEKNSIYQTAQTVIIRGETFHRTGYTQIGWATQPGGEKVYDFGDTYSSLDPITLYPVWQANTYTITYDSNGGTGSIADQTVTFDSTFTIEDCTFTREGYSFLSWNEDPEGKGLKWLVQEYTATRAENITLYAIWKGNEYTVSYNANNQLAEGAMEPSVAVFGSKFLTRRNQFHHLGITFLGWNTQPDGSGEAWLPSGESMDTFKRTSDAVWNISHDVTLYAQWDPYVYPYGRVFFDGKDSKLFGLVVENLPSYFYAERPFNHKPVNGKNGDVLLDPGRYENVKKVYKMACYAPDRNFFESAVALSTWLHSPGSDYLRLEDSYEPTTYRMAVYEEANEVENIEGVAGKVEVTFNCMPQRFLISGDDVININSSGTTVYNPTVYPAKPILEVEGVGTLSINNQSIDIYYNYNSLIIDCEKSNAQDLAGVNMNQYIYCDEFPVLVAGNNTITFTEGITSVKITPRWWIL